MIVLLGFSFLVILEKDILMLLVYFIWCGLFMVIICLIKVVVVVFLLELVIEIKCFVKIW